jgi:cell division protein ZapE
LRGLYQSYLDAGDLRPDLAQKDAVDLLDNFARQIEGRDTVTGRLWNRFVKRNSKEPRVSGLYMYGDVGRGKSMLMDMFFQAQTTERKRRVHFHQFMLEIQERLHKLQSDRVDDILPHVAKDIAADTWLLCFDEFHVSNIADAMILGRLFNSLFDEGVVIVATSNWPPDELYKNGLQRDRFLPFIDMIKSRMIVHELGSGVDHRYEHTKGLKTYFWPLGSEATRQLQTIFLRLTDDVTPETIELPVQGRTLKIVHAARGAGFFNFEELCALPLGAADYLAIAECLHTIVLDGVPQLKPDLRNETLRFMTFIDALYEANVKLFMAAASPPEKLYSSAGLHSFAFQRTVSRLVEMQGDEYRRRAHLS